jgi:hypothetical protein
MADGESLQLTKDEVAVLKEIVAAHQEAADSSDGRDIGRRDFMKSLAALGGSAVVAGTGTSALSGQATAQSSAESGQVGAPSSTVDVYGDDVYAVNLGVSGDTVTETHTDEVITQYLSTPGNDNEYELGVDIPGGGGSQGSSLLTDLGNGLVAYVGDGVSGTVDPESSSSPVQDAIDAINGTTSSGGTVILPPGITEDTGPITGLASISLQGVHAATEFAGDRASVLKITGANAGITMGDFDNTKHSHIGKFTLAGSGQSYPAIDFTGATKPRMFNMGRMRFENWRDSTRGVIHFNNAATFSGKWENLMLENNDGPGIFFDGNDPLAIKIENLYTDGDTADPAILCENRSPRIGIDFLNIGGAHSTAASFNTLTSNGYYKCDFTNYEPDSITSSTTVYDLEGLGEVHLGHVEANGFSGFSDVDQIVDLGFQNGNNWIKRLQAKSVTINNNLIRISDTPSERSYYYGDASDIDNVAGSSTGLVRTLAAAGAGNG